MSSELYFIFTGGTIDKVYSPVKETPIMRDTSIIPEVLSNEINVNFEFTSETVCMIDSHDMNEDIRKKILNAANASNVERIVITHGTSTMEVTASFLEEHLPKNHGKTIVITGAMVPITGFSYSDGRFNLGSAVTTALIADPGVYICMHGEIYKPGEVSKNTKTAHFDRINEKSR